MASFLLATLHIAAFETRYVDGVVRLLMRLFEVRYQLKPSYREPVSLLPFSPTTASAAQLALGSVAPHAEDSHA